MFKFQLEIDYEMIGPKYHTLEDVIPSAKEALKTSAIRVEIWRIEGKEELIIYGWKS